MPSPTSSSRRGRFRTSPGFAFRQMVNRQDEERRKRRRRINNVVEQQRDEQGR